MSQAVEFTPGWHERGADAARRCHMVWEMDASNVREIAFNGKPDDARPNGYEWFLVRTADGWFDMVTQQPLAEWQRSRTKITEELEVEEDAR